MKHHHRPLLNICLVLALVFSLSAFATAAPPGKPQLKPVDPAEYVKVCQGLIGMKETPLGSNRGPIIDQANRMCGIPASAQAPWCASIAHWSFAQLGAEDRPGAWSPSWFLASRKITSAASIRPGDTALVWFPSKRRFAHTIAAIESVQSRGRAPAIVTTLEGNTNAQGSREGDQFARRQRTLDTITVVRWWTP